ncbi:glycerol-3-phosphate dehydrogenase/oxidase [Microbacterium sp. cx-55]|uniref:glycerol-3-phosphate dehydrogenase/oxidase n=1 Tax=Microbacterium sp. cx-55 TaxID=2875948 RepID=UPI001CC15645|nr:glycerol-3-phosphate dehydrogenase/oxidase [Microbacterium sp. cx-55]MBZ4487557.1 glycerol-3-phosphate dehydrogenase/oxidase [Microbacterium sp. cx-55]UGB35577.1 glycerol-3-phosphate dehydrogenase/oxidase [Microbacterium sp. cx-55]
MSAPFARRLPGSPVDLLIIGAGITGTALAYEAASRGLRVAVVDAGDIGGRTSAATGKLIHGGLRYLKNFEVGLVRESLAERRTLMRIAPHLVEPVGMVLPDPGLIEHVGLTAYDVLSFDRNRIPDPAKRIPAHRVLSRGQLDARGLAHVGRGILYYDAMMYSPERLTFAFARTAQQHGATFSTYTRAERLLVRGSRVEGARVHDAVTGCTHDVRATVTVNAAGPWSHDLLSSTPELLPLAGPAPRVRSEGIYLVTRPLTRTMVLTVSGHGHFSVAPWRGHSLIGPTETPYSGAVGDWRLTRESIERLVDAVNAGANLPERLAIDDVVAAYGGLRPLSESSGDDTYRASRSSELVDHAKGGVDGLLSAVGGKYTNSRAFAEKVVDRLGRRAGLGAARSVSARTPLFGGDIADIGSARAAIVPDAAAASVAADTADLLLRHYGTQAREVLALMSEDPRLAERATPDGEPLATVAYAVRQESPVHLTDVLLRRTGIGHLGDPGDRILGMAADIAAEHLGWDAGRRRTELDAARRAVRLPVD